MSKHILACLGIALLLLSVFLTANFVLPVLAYDMPFCTVTGDYSVCTDQDDYTPNSIVHIGGSGFSPGESLLVKVTRPDGSVVTGDGSFGEWPTAYDYVTVDSDGKFQFDYVLDGISGQYNIEVLDSGNTVIASHLFTDTGKPDLTVAKTNNLGGGNAVVGTSFNWILTITNGGTHYANFDDKTVITDNLPNSGATYGTPTTTTSGGVTGTISCSVSSNTLTCVSGKWNDKLHIHVGDSVTVIVPVTPTSTGTLANPRSGGSCSVDPYDKVDESNEGNNACNSNSVTVNAVCGNNVIESGEQCDDGNLLNGDCCSSTCQTEPSATYYQDSDSDTYGNSAVSQLACSKPSGYVTDNTDCNDANAAVHPGATEVCDGVDNDCNPSTLDGSAESWYNQPTNCGLGVCAATGNFVCQAGVKTDTCAAGQPTGNDDNCNNIDENCDGTADNNYVPTATNCGVGECSAAGQMICTSGNLQDTCTSGTPTSEVCDNKDNDCDGTIDEELTRATTCGVGACTGNTGIETCTAGVWSGDTCNPYYGASSEICDNIDNDCDGITDESLTQSTSNQNGLCLGNTETCSAGSWIADIGNYLPTAETCDNLDNNCDGSIDESLTRAADNTLGLCSANTQTCSAGSWYDDQSNYVPTAEVCDNLDNNCNGVVDESLTRLTSNQNGLCDGNIETCSAGSWYADGTNYLPVDEVCDRLDNNCNGLVDELDQLSPTTTSNAPLGWKNTNVDITLYPSDNGVCGVQATYYCVDQTNICSPDTSGTSIVVIAEGTNYIRFLSVDNSGFGPGYSPLTYGNVETVKSATVQIDKTKPVISGSATADGSPYTTGTWTNKNVVVSFTCADAGLVQSGIATNTIAGDTVSIEGADQSVTNTGVCTDNAGNSADSATASNIDIDKTLPSVDAGTDKTTNMLFTQDATVSDVASGIASFIWTKESGPGTITFGTPNSEDTTVSADTDGTYVIKLTATDNVGNSNFDTMTLVWDTVKPTVTSVDSDGDTYNLATASPQTIEVTFSENIVNTPTIAVSGSDQTVNNCGDADSKTFCFDYAIPASTEATETVQISGAQDAATNTMLDDSTHTFTVDTRAPVITINNPDTTWAQSKTITASTGEGTLYQSVTTGSVCDDTLTFVSYASITFISESDNGKKVCYKAVDTASNTVYSLSNAIAGIDTTAPTIDAHGNVVEEATSSSGAVVTYTSPATHDAVDGDGTATCAPVSGSTFTLGDIIVTCSAVDAAGNHAIQTTFNVHVVDTTAPTIDNVVDIVAEATGPSGASVTIILPTSHDAVDGDLVSSCDYSTGTFALGVTTVTCTKTDAAGNIATPEVFTVTVEDTTPPVITLTGANPQTLEAKTAYVELGATASDNYDGDISGSIVIDATNVNMNLVGTYTVTYDVTDAHGNNAVRKSRTVNVVDTTKPVITLLGTAPVTIEIHSTYTDAGATALDNYDGDITSSIVTVNPVDINTVGTYTITYNVVDAHSNAAVQVTRTVNVVDTTPPTCSIVSPANNAYLKGSEVIEIHASDSGSGIFSVEWSLDNQAWIATTLDNGSYVATWDTAGVADGSYYIHARALDNVGLEFYDPVLVIVDNTPPLITVVSPANITYTTSSVELSFSVNEATASLTYSLDGGANETATNKTISGLSNGVHNLIIYASDLAGNKNSTEIYFTVSVDSSAGQTATQPSNSGIFYGATISSENVQTQSPTATSKVIVNNGKTIIRSPKLEVDSICEETIIPDSIEMLNHEESKTFTVNFDCKGISFGEYPVTYTLKSNTGKVIASKTYTLTISETGIKIPSVVILDLSLPSLSLGETKDASVTIENTGDGNTNGNVSLNVPDGLSISPFLIPFYLLAGEKKTVSFEVTANAPAGPAQVDIFTGFASLFNFGDQNNKKINVSVDYETPTGMATVSRTANISINPKIESLLLPLLIATAIVSSIYYYMKRIKNNLKKDE